MKRKLLFAAMLCIVGALTFNVHAQEDITSQYLTNAALSTVDNGWTYYSDASNAYKYQDWRVTGTGYNDLKDGSNESFTFSADSYTPAVEFYSGWSSLEHEDFKFSQTITLPAGDYRIAVNAFYREGNDGNGTNADKAWIFAGETKQNVHAMTSAEGSSLRGLTEFKDIVDAMYAFKQGQYSNAFDFSLAEETQIELGFQGKFTTKQSWCILGPVKLYKYSLENYLVDYRAKVAEAQALYDTPMNADVLAALKAAVVDESSFSLSKEVTAAIQALTTAITNANTSISNYTAIKAKLDAANSFDETGKASYAANETVAAVQSAYDARSIVSLSSEQSTAMDAALATAAKSQTTAGADMTLAISNPSFENGFSGWTYAGMATQGNTSFALKAGNTYVEKWLPNGTFSVKQELTLLQSGVYRLSAGTLARYVTSAKVFAGDVDKAVAIDGVASTTNVEFACDANATVTIGFEGVGTGTNDSWLCVDNFQLTYVGALPELTAVEGNMNKEVADAQTTAINTYNSNKTVANYNTAVAAINAAQASKDAYAVAATAIADAKAIKEAHNFAPEAAVTAFESAIAAIETAYKEGTLTDADANGAAATLGTSVTGHHGGANSAASNYLEAGLGLNDFDAALYINTWSNEGASDGSNFVVPFYEYWTADANSLGEKTWSGTLSSLPNGLYSVTAWVRVRAKNGTAATDATGITMDVNGGVGEFAAVDVTEGEQVGTSQFQLKEYTAQGLVKDGNLTLNFNVAADNNISWLSFKNVKYTKERDLTEAEAAVVPTAIALDVTEVALDATTTTKTLVLTFTPENATPNVTWTTSDASVATVADGVVTAVSTGVATITVTSTLDAEVSATATVTVTFPETEVATEDVVIDGPAKSSVTYGKNLIKNGTFEYPDGFYGWTDATAGRAKLTATNFTIVTDGDNKYLQGKNNQGVAGAASIGTAWPIEAGKTYVFGYKVKNEKKAGDTSYQVLSLVNDLSSTSDGPVVKSQKTATQTSWTDINYKFTNTDYAYVQFRARWLADANNSGKISFDDFYLCEVTDEKTIGNVDYATAAIPTANIGTAAFQYSQTAVDAANALVQGEATVEDVQAAYDALQTLNAPADGQLFNVVLTYANYTYDNKAMTYIAGGRNNEGNYNIQYQSEANQNLAQAFTFTKVEGNNYKLSQIDADGNVRYVSTGKPYGGNDSQIRTTTTVEDAAQFTVIATATEGVYNLKNVAANNYIGSQDAGVYTVNSHINFFIKETSKPSITINTTVAGWGTTMLPFAVAELPDGVKAYTCAAVEGNTLTLEEANSLEANKPYIIEGPWNETLTGDAKGTALTYTDGLLTGVYAATPAPVGTYVLQNLDNNVAFYLVKEVDGKTPTVGANRAYLTAPESGVKAFYFGAADAIKNVFDGVASGEIYDLSGRKVSKMQKGGVYVINGKKVLIK